VFNLHIAFFLPDNSDNLPCTQIIELLIAGGIKTFRNHAMITQSGLHNAAFRNVPSEGIFIVFHIVVVQNQEHAKSTKVRQRCMAQLLRDKTFPRMLLQKRNNFRYKIGFGSLPDQSVQGRVVANLRSSTNQLIAEMTLIYFKLESAV
jgi:hypothetical protein